MNVYVLKTEQKGEDGLYHHYFTEEDRFLNAITEHLERQSGDGTYTCVGDYMLGEALFHRALTKEVEPKECSVGVAFRDHNMVTKVPAGNDHIEGGLEYVEFVVNEQIKEDKNV